MSATNLIKYVKQHPNDWESYAIAADAWEEENGEADGVGLALRFMYRNQKCPIWLPMNERLTWFDFGDKYYWVCDSYKTPDYLFQFERQSHHQLPKCIMWGFGHHRHKKWMPMVEFLAERLLEIKKYVG